MQDKNTRRSTFDFSEMNIKVNDDIEFKKGNIDIFAKVINDRQVLYEGKEYYLSALADELTNGEEYGVNHFYYNGRNFLDIYEETYGA